MNNHDAHDPLGCVVMARAATEAGVIVTADIDNIYAGLTELAPRIDILITSNSFSQRIIIAGFSD